MSMSQQEMGLKVPKEGQENQREITVKTGKNNDYGLFQEYGQSEKISNNFYTLEKRSLVRQNYVEFFKDQPYCQNRPS